MMINRENERKQKKKKHKTTKKNFSLQVNDQQLAHIYMHSDEMRFCTKIKTVDIQNV